MPGRGRADEELRLLREITTRISEGITLTRARDLKIIYANPEFARMWGYKPAEVIGLPLDRLDDPAAGPPGANSACIIKAVKRHGFWSGELRNIKKDGTPFWSSAKVSAFRDIEHGLVYVAAHTDITRRKRAENSLRLSEAALSEAERLAGIGHSVHDLLAHRTFRSEGMLRILGLTRKEMPAYPEAILRRVLATDRDRVAKILARSMKAGSPFNTDYHIQRPDGSQRVIHAEGKATKDERGRPTRLFIWTQDVTARRKAEETLRHNEAMLAEAERLAGIASIDIDLVRHITHRSAGFHHITGRRSGRIKGRIEAFLRFLHKDDRAEVRESLRQCVTQGKSFRSEHRIRRPDGTERIVHAEGQAVANKDGRPTRIFVWLQDITERKRAEKELQRNEAMLEEAELLAGIGSVDYDIISGRVLRSNGLGKLFGVKTGLLRNKFESFLRYTHEDDRPRVTTALRQSVNMGSPYRIDYRIRRPDGTVRLVHGEGGLRKNQSGRPVRFFTWLQDITEHRRLEERVQQISDRERRNIGHDLHDDLGQQLTGIALLGRALQERLAAQSSTEAAAMTSLLQHMDRCMARLRELAHGLRPVPAQPDGLADALSALASHARSTSGIRCDFRNPQRATVGCQETANHLFRIAQEAVQNALKHGQPRRLDLCLIRQGREIILTVADDGSGFQAASQRAGGMGLDIMRHRADLCHGALAVSSRAGKGTVITCRVPVGISREGVKR